MAICSADDPAILYRIGRPDGPLSWPPKFKGGKGRYNDPQNRVSVLYAASDRVTVFMETLDQFRADIVTLADVDLLLSVPQQASPIRYHGSVTVQYMHKQIVRFSVEPGHSWLDVRSPETHAMLRTELAPQLSQLGIGSRFVLGDLLSHDHRVTRAIAGWAIDNGFHGIAYASCHDPSLTCWALFEGAAIHQVGNPQSIVADDPDLMAVAELWNLRIPEAIL